MVAALVVERHDEDAGGVDPCGVQQFGAGGVAEEALEAEAAHEFDRFEVVVEDDGLEARELHEPVHDLPEAADARDDDGVLFVDLVGREVGGAGVEALRDLFEGDEEERRQQHREGDDEEEGLARLAGQDAGLDGEGEERRSRIRPPARGQA